MGDSCDFGESRPIQGDLPRPKPRPCSLCGYLDGCHTLDVCRDRVYAQLKLLRTVPGPWKVEFAKLLVSFRKLMPQDARTEHLISIFSLQVEDLLCRVNQLQGSSQEGFKEVYNQATQLWFKYCLSRVRSGHPGLPGPSGAGNDGYTVEAAYIEAAIVALLEVHEDVASPDRVPIWRGMMLSRLGVKEDRPS